MLNINFIYELPFLKNRRDVLGRIAGGWQVSGVTFYRSGSPISIVDTVDTAGVGPGSGSQPWDVVGDPKVTGARGLGLPWFRGEAFARPANGKFGNAGMNLLRGPGFGNWDMAVFKNFRWMEGRMNTQFRAEAFNFPNHPNLGNPNSNPRGGFFGVITSKSGERNLQLGLKLSF